MPGPKGATFGLLDLERGVRVSRTAGMLMAAGTTCSPQDDFPRQQFRSSSTSGEPAGASGWLPQGKATFCSPRGGISTVDRWCSHSNCLLWSNSPARHCAKSSVSASAPGGSVLKGPAVLLYWYPAQSLQNSASRVYQASSKSKKDAIPPPTPPACLMGLLLVV